MISAQPSEKPHAPLKRRAEVRFVAEQAEVEPPSAAKDPESDAFGACFHSPWRFPAGYDMKAQCRGANPGLHKG